MTEAQGKQLLILAARADHLANLRGRNRISEEQYYAMLNNLRELAGVRTERTGLRVATVSGRGKREPTPPDTTLLDAGSLVRTLGAQRRASTRALAFYQ